MGIIDFVAGAFGGFANLLVGHPFDTIKVRLQVEGLHGKFKTPLDCFRKTIRHEGACGLYKGVALPFFGKGMIHSCIFGVNEQMLEWLAPNHKENSGDVALSSVLFSGLIAGWASTILVTPIDQIKVLLQTQYHSTRSHSVPRHGFSHYTGAINCAANLVRTHGLFGMYKQLPSTMLEMSGMSLFFAGCHLTNLYLQDIRAAYKHNRIVDSVLGQPWLAFLSGASGGIAMQLGVFPMEAVKHRLMTQMRSSECTYTGILDCIQSMFRSEGIRAFYKGLSPALIRTIPTTGTTFSSFYIVKTYLVPGDDDFKRLCPITD